MVKRYPCPVQPQNSRRRNPYNRRCAARKGIILLSVIIIFITLAIAGTSLASFFLIVNGLAQENANQVKAFYVAEAGVSHALYILKHQAGADVTSNQEIGPIQFADGAYTLRIDFDRQIITATGRVDTAERTVQIKYKPL